MGDQRKERAKNEFDKRLMAEEIMAAKRKELDQDLMEAFSQAAANAIDRQIMDEVDIAVPVEIDEAEDAMLTDDHFRELEREYNFLTNRRPVVVEEIGPTTLIKSVKSNRKIRKEERKKARIEPKKREDLLEWEE